MKASLSPRQSRSKQTLSSFGKGKSTNASEGISLVTAHHLYGSDLETTPLGLRRKLSPVESDYYKPLKNNDSKGKRKGGGKGKGKDKGRHGPRESDPPGRTSSQWSSSWASKDTKGRDFCRKYHLGGNCNADCGTDRSHRCPIVMKNGILCNQSHRAVNCKHFQS